MLSSSVPLAKRAKCDASSELNCEVIQVDSESEAEGSLVSAWVEVATSDSEVDVRSNISTCSWPDDAEL